MAEQRTFDVAIVGAGPVGLITGLACAACGLKPAVIGPAADPADGRTAALLDGSINLLKRLQVWSRIDPISEPLTGIRLVDATGSLLRAPEVLFRASEVGLEAFGYNVPNAGLTAALEAACTSRLTRIVSKGVTAFDLGGDLAQLTTSEGATLFASLVAAADGRASATRAAAGIATSGWSYPQAAVVTTFTHGRPHFGISTELHHYHGPLTVVPGPKNTSSLVWVESPAEAEGLAGLTDCDFAHALGSRLHGLLGTLSCFTPRRTYPLASQRAPVMGKNRVALVGEAAHLIPPIGAQGLNLGFRDAATLAEAARDALHEDNDIGGEAALAHYDRLRQADVTSRFFAVDLLNRSLLSRLPGVQLARALGLFALAVSPPLRRRIMREGIMPSAASPALMLPIQLHGDTADGTLDCPAPQQA